MILASRDMVNGSKLAAFHRAVQSSEVCSTKGVSRAVSKLVQTSQVCMDQQKGRCPGLVIYMDPQWIYRACDKDLTVPDARPENDHVHELRYGGADEPKNIQRLCHQCHRGPDGKTSRNHSAWMDGRRQEAF